MSTVFLERDNFTNKITIKNKTELFTGFENFQEARNFIRKFMPQAIILKKHQIITTENYDQKRRNNV